MTDKSRILPFPDKAAIETEAAMWVARFDAGDVSARDQASFQDWVNRSARHRAALAEYGNLWSEFDALRLLTQPAAPGKGGMRDSHPAMTNGTMPRLAAACAAIVIVAVAGAAVFFHPAPRAPASAIARVILPHPVRELVKAGSAARFSYETAVGGQRRIVLADGSSVILNTNSRLDGDFSGGRRDIHLVRGEAYFEVVHDKTRPFTVYASNYVVRDIGTAFDVHLSKKCQVEVGVTKGSVEVAPLGGAHGIYAAKSLGVIVAGHNIVLGRKVERTEIMSIADMGRKLAWRQGELIYTGQPLSEVLADVSRYSDIKIELADPALENLPVGGAFRTDQIEAIFAALENNFGIHAEWIGPQHVRFVSGRATEAVKD